MKDVTIRHEGAAIDGHFIIAKGERSQQHLVQPTADGDQYVCFGWGHVATIIVALMKRIENPINDLDKARAQEGLDQICGLVGSHGVITNLQKIRAELCQDCTGLGAPGQEIMTADIVAKSDASGISPGKHPVSTDVS
jgi:hypothetical protein